jgi:F420-non-reducing hydrogenase iron-sulfur subunit
VGDCHYVSGNHRTAKRLPLYKKLIEFIGIEPERLYLKWVSASEGTIFAQVVKEFTETLRALPPMRERLKRPGAPSRG